MEAGGDSQNLRDFLKMKQDDNFHRSSGNYSGMTLNAVLSDKSGQETETLDRNQSNRTLLDIIREESSIDNTDAPGKRSWRHFREKLRLRRNASGSNWTSSVRIPASDIPFNNNSTQRSFTQFGTESGRLLQRNSSRSIDRASGRFEHTSSLAMRRSSNRENEIDDEAQVVVSGGGEEDDDEEESGGQQSGGRTSLMALLAETDRQMGLDGVGYMMDGEDEDEEDESVTGGGGGGDYNNCCVCMVRHKGAAFIPCGHTFCRLCSRELFAQRGNCPLCNNYILEILDIF